MPFDYRIDGAKRIVLSRAYGIFTETDMVGHREGLIADLEFDSTYYQLADLTEVTEVQMTSEFLRDFAELGRSMFDAGARRAIVAPDDVTYGLARVLLGWLGSSKHNYRLFRDMAEARKWLGLD